MNAYEQLRRTDDLPAARPDPRFAARLRAQIEAALAPTIELPQREDHPMTDTATSSTDTSSTTTSSTGAATQILVPYLAVADAAAALDWYTAALDGTETIRYVGDDGRIGHAEMIVHGARIMLSDAYPEIGVVAADSYEGSSCALHLEVADIDAVHASAVQHGAVAERDPADQPHGSRMSTIVDPFGHRWMLSQTIAAPTAAEIDAAMSDFTVIEAASTPRRPGLDRTVRSSWATTRSTRTTSPAPRRSIRRRSAGTSTRSRAMSATATCRSASRPTTARASGCGCRSATPIR